MRKGRVTLEETNNMGVLLVALASPGIILLVLVSLFLIIQDTLNNQGDEE